MVYQNSSVAGVSRLAHLQSVIESGKVALGAVLSLCDPQVAEIAGYAGMDFVWIDSEHAAYNVETLKMMIIAACAGNCAPLVRVRGNDSDLLKPVLDMNPAGVIIPMIKDAADAERAVAACRYFPYGIRGCGIKRGSGYNTIKLDRYLDESKSAPWVIIQIEHVDAVKNLDKILAVPGINSICVGPCDLAVSMGYAHDMENPEVHKVIDEICAKVKNADIPLGTASGNLPLWKKRGINWFAGTGDVGLIAAGMRNFRKNSDTCLME